jgi:hypothetical protein
MFSADPDLPTPDDIERFADSGVRVFLSAYGARA